MGLRAIVTGTGMYVPERIVTNDDLAQRMDTSDEWIQKRTGIRERHHVVAGETPVDLALAASERALAAAGLEPADLDAIILATLSPHADFPGTSFFLHERLGVAEIPCFDLRAQCSGFVYSLAVANSFIRSEMFKRVLVVGCEVHSTGLDFSTEGRDVAVLFGDGAGAVVVESRDGPDDGPGILEIRLHAEGKHARKLWLEAPGSGLWPHRIDREVIEAGLHFPKMDGRVVFKHAVTRMPQVLLDTLGAASLKLEDIHLFLFHQANLRINEYVANQLEIPPEKCLNNIQQYGNCSAASIPMLLDEAVRSDRLLPGQLVSMTSFGSGFSWTSAVVRWG
ncbi:MAG: beta-ketoacyl-ACP synthase III [Myxococcota bacterium]